jgi:hypothetical protein
MKMNLLKSLIYQTILLTAPIQTHASTVDEQQDVKGPTSKTILTSKDLPRVLFDTDTLLSRTLHYYPDNRYLSEISDKAYKSPEQLLEFSHITTCRRTRSIFFDNSAPLLIENVDLTLILGQLKNKTGIRMKFDNDNLILTLQYVNKHVNDFPKTHDEYHVAFQFRRKGF